MTKKKIKINIIWGSLRQILDFSLNHPFKHVKKVQHDMTQARLSKKTTQSEILTKEMESSSTAKLLKLTKK